LYITIYTCFFIFYAGQRWIQARRGPDPRQKEFLSPSGIVGILVAVILVIAAVGIAIYFVVRNRYSLLSKWIFIYFKLIIAVLLF
jgi:hypothetical protein